VDSLSKKIIDTLLGWGADLVGIAPAERFANAPEGHRPTDFMPECKSVISVGLHLFQGVADVWHDDPGRLDKTITPYLFYGYGLTNMESSRVVNRMAKTLEYRGHKTLCFLPTWFVSMARYMEETAATRKIRAEFSHRHAAVAAGIAQMGWNGLALTPEFGPMQLCRKDKCGTKCARICPAQAFSDTETQEMVIDGVSTTYAGHDAVRCVYGVYGMIQGAGGRSDVKIPEGPGDLTHLRSTMKGKDTDSLDRAMRDNCFGIICGDFCGKCLHQCPSKKLAQDDLGQYDMSARHNSVNLDVLG
jgi:epoxyqueuosine reductase QueG